MTKKTEGINQESVKQSNRSSILKLISRVGEISRKDIAALVGLTPAAVTLICSELIEEGVLIEKGEVTQEKRAGRKKRLVDINYEYKKVLCIAIEIDETYISIANMGGELCAQRIMETDTSIEPEEFLKKIAQESKEFLWKQGMSKDSMLAAGISITGIVDQSRGISLHAYRVWDRKVNVRQFFEEEFGFPVVVDNNINAYAHGELIYGIGREARNIVFVKWGPGVGSSFTINNQVYQGREFKGAEIGHFIVTDEGVKKSLESAISTHAILESVQKRMQEVEMPGIQAWINETGQELRVQNIYEWGTVKDVELQKIIDRKIDLLARTVDNVINMLNPDYVVFYGKIFDVPSISERFVRQCCFYETDIPEDYIIQSALSNKISYIGPLALVMKNFFF